ncbi:MAG: zeta toxin family protein [Pseudomonadota bacterium]
MNGSRDPVEDHRLSDDRHQEIRRKIAAKEIGRCEPAERPKIIILAGQPGAGKGGLQTEAEQELAPEGGAVVIDVDALRDRHDDYPALMRENDRTAASAVQSDAGRWGDGLRQDATAARRNIILDGTLKSPDKAEALCREMKEEGYEVDLRVMAVRRQDSEIGVQMRYHKAKLADRPGRSVPQGVQDQGYEGVPRSVAVIERKGLADRVSVHGRGLTPGQPTRRLYDSDQTGGVGEAGGGGGSAVDALEEERNRPRTAEEQTLYEDKLRDLQTMIRTNDPELRDPENKKAMEMVNKNQPEAGQDPAPDTQPDPTPQQRQQAEQRAMAQETAPERDPWDDDRDPQKKQETDPWEIGREDGSTRATEPDQAFRQGRKDYDKDGADPWDNGKDPRPDQQPHPGGGRTR